MFGAEEQQFFFQYKATLVVPGDILTKFCPAKSVSSWIILQMENLLVLVCVLTITFMQPFAHSIIILLQITCRYQV